MMKYYEYLETAGNLSDKNLALLFCQVVVSLGSPKRVNMSRLGG